MNNEQPSDDSRNSRFTSTDSELIILEEKDMKPGMPPGWSEKHRKLLEEKYRGKLPPGLGEDVGPIELT